MKMMSKFFHVFLLSLAVCALPAQETASSQSDRGLLGSLFRPLSKLSETAYSLKTILTDPISEAQPLIPGAAALGKTADEVAAKATAIAVPADTKEAAVKTVAPADEATAKAATTAAAASKNAAVPADTAKAAVTGDAAKEAVTADAKAAAPATAPAA